VASSPTVLAGQDLTAALLGVPAFTAMSLLNSWVNVGAGFVTAQFRVWPLINQVEVVGAIANGTITNGTAIATLTSTPASIQDIPMLIIGGSPSGGTAGVTPLLRLQTSGSLQVFDIPTSTTQVMFHGWYSLDA